MKKKKRAEGYIKPVKCKLSTIPSTKRAQVKHRRVLKSLGGVR